MNTIEQKALNYLEDHSDTLFALLSELITFDTQNYSTHGNEQNCIDFIKKQYTQLNLESEIYYPDFVEGMLQHEGYLLGRGTDKRPNISGVYRGRKGVKRVMLAAHTDTMPIGDESLWSVPPLGGIIKDEKIFGRGASDDKFGIAVSIMALEVIKECGISLESDVVLTSYCDEEYGGGNGALASCLKYPCDTYINLDGGNYELWVRSMGGCVVRVTVESKLEKDTASSVIEALEVVREELKSFEERRHRELSNDPYFKDSNMMESVLRILEYRAGYEGCDLGKGYVDFVFYTNKTEKELDIEFVAMKKVLDIKLEDMQMKCHGFTKKSRFFHCLTTTDSDEAVAFMQKAASEVAGRQVLETGGCLSDLSLFLKYGSSSSFNFGIFRDFKLYGGAHQPDEYVDCQELLDSTKALILFLIRWGKGEVLPLYRR
ncbi:MAG: M20/M25/M40 family metallo-hydrolase [Sphaerochaeta sp.]|nr:M20/M25/M40 family metallo-hydrolase [Sphaerochaeta sp.]